MTPVHLKCHFIYLKKIKLKNQPHVVVVIRAGPAGDGARRTEVHVFLAEINRKVSTLHFVQKGQLLTIHTIALIFCS